jgi:Ca2+-binding RTX toxin-like protein
LKIHIDMTLPNRFVKIILGNNATAWSNQVVTKTGNANPNTLNGTGNNDSLFGLGGADTLNGKAGNDLLDGGSGGDEVFGGDGNDTFVHGAGSDVMDGGLGFDTVTYASAGSAINLTLSVFEGGGDAAQGDTVTNIERVIGSRFGDQIYGSDNIANFLYGGKGGDDLRGGELTDYLYGGAGSDRLFGSDDSSFDGGDFLYGGKGGDELVGYNGEDTLVGGAGADFLYGGDDSDSISGGAGADVIGGGDSSNSLSGGGGADEFQFFTFDFGTDVVSDFDGGEGDTVLLVTQGQFDSFADILAASLDSPEGVIITLQLGHTVRLDGVEKADLRASWFDILN